MHHVTIWASMVAQMVKNPPAMRETWVQSLGGEDPLEEGMANEHQYSCLENPMDRGTWWATVHGGCKESDLTERLIRTYITVYRTHSPLFYQLKWTRGLA